ncbi:Oidioi.mRNA.OKI2018_I69.chr2.g7530.t1.cds [Oikopleura dioica]|uniref:Sulfhydryl oxidase n=1 Tax=Oikopleura dioica TaxID=34765 RepID=A0ABN7TCE1_OIKDI|nr:Oidioi.mRNA.OKI2018_I69.chr2.g7530.t1.cds [Oikopleura dioica]
MPRSRRDRERLEEQDSYSFDPFESSASSAPNGVQLNPDGTPCRACSSVQDVKARLGDAFGVGNSSVRNDCAPDVNQIGNAGWTILHTMAAYYPDKPSPEKKAAVLNFYDSFSKLYPCSHCAEDLRQDLKEFKVRNESRASLSIWTCEMHNRVNEKLGKETYKCDLDWLDQRWRDGWKDGSCDL